MVGCPTRTLSSRTPRNAKTSATGSAIWRRATNASVCAEIGSSHCASSITHTNGRSSATSASRLSTASPTRNLSGGGPACMPKAVASASRCGPGRRSRWSSIGAHSWCRPENGSSTSDSTPVARASRQLGGAHSPGSPAELSSRPRPRRAARAPGSHRRASGPPGRQGSRTRCCLPRSFVAMQPPGEVDVCPCGLNSDRPPVAADPMAFSPRGGCVFPCPLLGNTRHDRAAKLRRIISHIQLNSSWH